jgi:hypothetical protein
VQVATRCGRLSACWAALVTAGMRRASACFLVRFGSGREFGGSSFVVWGSRGAFVLRRGSARPNLQRQW